MRASPIQGRLPYNPLGKKVGISIMPLLEFSRDAIFMKEKALRDAACSPRACKHQKTQKMPKLNWSHAQNFQERCFYGGKSPCGMQRARQELGKLNSVKIQPKMIEFQYKSEQNCNESGIWELGVPRVCQT